MLGCCKIALFDRAMVICGCHVTSKTYKLSSVPSFLYEIISELALLHILALWHSSSPQCACVLVMHVYVYTAVMQATVIFVVLVQIVCHQLNLDAFVLH